MSRSHLVLLLSLIALGSAPVYGVAPGAISGVVRDSQGVAQVSAVVQLLRPDLTVIASVFTDSTGHYKLPPVLPGRYAVKAMGATFLPSLREDVRVRSSTVVNLTLNTLYEVMEWLPAEPRAGNAQQDDWKWTLRAAANRPLLRWLEDGPLVVVSDSSGGSPKLKARLVATGQEGSFGESGERVSVALEETPANSRELLAQVDFDPDSPAGMESMLGFRQDLGFAGSVQAVAAMAIHPEVDAAGSEGLDEAAMRSWETIRLGDELEGEVGSTQVLARFAQNSPNTVLAALPFASVAWHDGASTIHYRMATSVPAAQDAEDTEAQAWLPALSMRDGQLALEHGLHQEAGWERSTENSDMAVLVYADKIDNPILQAMGRPAQGSSVTASAPGAVLYDPESGLVRAAGPGFSSAGMVATVNRKLPRGNQVRVSYANGNALVLSGSPQSAGLAQVLASPRARHTQTYSISLSGTLDGSGTRWRATYRWQPEATVTPVAAFAQDAADPYLNLQFRQPIHIRRDGTGGFEALVNLRNLLAQGYRPYLLSDGSLLVFAAHQRSFGGGVAFSF
ncbi:MAG: carboxypeptidase-like regulatory domain-containing protein [Terracidiphilus sp.]